VLFQHQGEVLKLITLMLGLTFLTTTVAVYAQSTSDTAKKANKKAKGKKSTDANSTAK